MFDTGIPTIWQKVIFRNYGMVSNEKIAKAINADANTVVFNAQLLGLGGVEYLKEWVDNGFVTIIRNNWDLLPNNIIADFIDKTEKEFDELLIEYDFLDVKLGVKPEVFSAQYMPLSEEELLKTEQVGKIVKNNFIPDKVKRFDFYNGYVKPVCVNSSDYVIKERFTACYSGNYGSVLLDDELTDYSEGYLEKISSTGINGLWIHETLRNLSEFPFDVSLSPDYKRRVANLKKLTERCKRFGISVYVYLNEPRSLPKDFFDKYPNLKGQSTENGYCLCTSAPEVKEYLYDAFKSLAENVPLLKGILLITMSENWTNCYSRSFGKKIDCPRCVNRSQEEVVTEINNIVCKALRDGNGYTKLITHLWGWSQFTGWTVEMLNNAISMLDKDTEVLTVSEYDKEFVRGGVNARVVDYSISVVGPSEVSANSLELAKNNGHETWAKIQVNNSWECSGVPYVPVFDLMVEHIKNIKAIGVSRLMMGWSLGGYPGGALPLCNGICSENFDEDEWYNKTYGKETLIVRNAVKLFSDAYKEYPFGVSVLYFGAQNLACGNFWSLKFTGCESTMVCFTYDDYEKWTEPYSLDVYIEQFNKLCSKWDKGLDLISDVYGNPAFNELKIMAKATYVHMKSTYNFAMFTKLKKNVHKNRQKLLECVICERKLTKLLLELISVDAKIGYEMTNHYFYNKNLLLEKLLNLNEIEKQLG